jgi:hypothetical protein
MCRWPTKFLAFSLLASICFSNFSCGKFWGSVRRSSLASPTPTATANCRLMGGAALGCGTLNLLGTVTAISAAGWNNPFGVTTDGTSLYVSDRNNNAIKKIQ